MRYLQALLAAIVIAAFLAVLATHPPGRGAGSGTNVQEAQPTASRGTEPPATQGSTAARQVPAPAPSQLARSTAPAAPAQPAAPPPAPTAAAPPSPSSGTSTPAEQTAGRQVFRKCQACHSLDPGKNLVGPSLAGIIGRKAGSEPGFTYSDAMKHADITWNAKTLDAYLDDPQKVVPGNRMPFPGLKSEHDRSDVIAYLAAASGQPRAAAAQPAPGAGKAPAAGAQPQPPAGAGQPTVGMIPDVKYTLRTGIAEGRMVFIGVGGVIDGKVNPVLSAAEGQVVQVTLINGEGAEHDIAFPDENSRSPRVTGKGASTTIAFRAGQSGDFVYFCTVPGHRLAGMEGKFVVTPKPPAQVLAYADISREPTDLPPPLPKRGPQTVRVDLVTVELEGRLAEGTTFGYWTFNGKVPGPFLRARVGDTIDIHLKNSAGGEKSMTFKLLAPGLYVYHCATPMVAEHIANGMYGLILVEPEGGLPKVDHEFHVMQGEIYTTDPFGQHGSQDFSVEKLLAEHPEYFVFNGSVGALSSLHPLHAKVGETVRIFFGVGGPNFTSSFHVIGEIFNKVYNLGGVINPPAEGIQTVTVAPGGAVITEFKLEVPGRYILVDHALARMERGLSGLLMVDGPPNKEIYNGEIMAGGGGH